MTEKDSDQDQLSKVVSLCKRRGFVFQSSEIYGGLRSAYDYGPLGVELKRNLMNEWWSSMVHTREDIVGIDASIIMHPRVWRASGHVANFSDPLVDCKVCGERFRADKAPKVAAGSKLTITLGDKERAPRQGAGGRHGGRPRLRVPQLRLTVLERRAPVQHHVPFLPGGDRPDRRR